MYNINGWIHYTVTDSYVKMRSPKSRLQGTVIMCHYQYIADLLLSVNCYIVICVHLYFLFLLYIYTLTTCRYKSIKICHVHVFV